MSNSSENGITLDNLDVITRKDVDKEDDIKVQIIEMGTDPLGMTTAFVDNDEEFTINKEYLVNGRLEILRYYFHLLHHKCGV